MTVDEITQSADRDARLRESQERRRRQLVRLVPLLAILVFLVYAFTTNFIPSGSMEPTLKPGDHILTMREWLAYPFGRMPARGDIILFRAPQSVEAEDSQDDSDAADAAVQQNKNPLAKLQNIGADILIKRVVGLPGDTVLIRGNDVYINGKKVVENYETIPVGPLFDMSDYKYAVNTPLKVPEGQLFVLGDNRTNSEDGRFWGTLKRADVVGKFIGILYHERERKQITPPPLNIDGYHRGFPGMPPGFNPRRMMEEHRRIIEQQQQYFKKRDGRS